MMIEMADEVVVGLASEEGMLREQLENVNKRISFFMCKELKYFGK